MLSRMIDGLGLEDAYGATIERIKAQGGDKSRLGMAALMWICHAERPLMVVMGTIMLDHKILVCSSIKS